MEETKGFVGKVIYCGESFKAGLTSNFSLRNYKSKFRGPDATPVPPTHLKAFPAPDTEAILQGCAFVKDARENPEGLDAARASVAVDILIHAAKTGSAESKALCFDSLENVPGLAPKEVQSMIARSMEFGPRSCASVHVKCADKSKCLECPNWGKVTSPVMIKGVNYIATEATGFHVVTTTDKGVKRIPDYEGLRRAFYREHPYLTVSSSETTYRYTGKMWEEVFDSDLRGFAHDRFRPQAKNHMRNEFTSLIECTELRAHEFFYETTVRKMNFSNGVLDIDTMKFTPHSPVYGFRSVLPYDYDPEARCPKFEQFLRDVTLSRQELIDILLEFAGYSLSNDKCWEQKAIVLQGEGRNGKSKLVSVVKALAGEGNSTALTLVDLEKDTNRFALDGSLFNIAEETPSKSLMDSSLFKNLVSGGEVSVKQLYKQPYTIRNRSKFWLLCNEMPRTFDKSYAMFRRLVIVPFQATFTGENEDKHIEEKLFGELPGIFNLVIAHYNKMRDRKELSPSAISDALVESYKIENDNVARWFTGGEVEVVVGEYDTKPQELYNSYRNFCDLEGEKCCASPSFFKRLTNVWPDYAHNTHHRRLRAGGYPERVVRGIRVLNEAHKTYGR